MNWLQRSLPRDVDHTAFSTSIDAVRHEVARKRVLITGAGGSIGLALAQAVALCEPEELVLVEAAEQALFRLNREIKEPHREVLADVCDQTAMNDVFERFHPQIVFHAAAFKHVALLEQHPFAAMQNNAVGTFRLAQAAVRSGAEQMVIVSTDKAVEPVSVLGASKMIAELTALAVASDTTHIKAVRLGNVYGSQGSVVPLFEQQVAAGMAVTVTHPDAARYFVRVDEAVALLLLALSKAFPSTILVPELAEPVRIEEIAKDLIRAGASDVAIAYIGLKPGEKLHEKLIGDSEQFVGDGIGPLRAIRRRQIDAAEATTEIAALGAAIRARNFPQLVGVIERLVPEYQPSEIILAQLAAAGCRP